MFIYKICPHLEWEQAVDTGYYAGSLDDQRDGFIHFSTSEQLEGTAGKHFAGRDDLVLIAFASDELADTLRWEASRSGEQFPHVYGQLDINAAAWVKPLPLGAHGHIFPGLDGG